MPQQTKNPSTRRRSSSSPGARSRPNRSRDGSASTAAERVKGAGSALSGVAEKAKVPALAAGAGLVGLAGGVALGSRNARKRVLGLPMPSKSGAQAVSKNLAEAARNVGSFGEGMGSLASELRKAREGLAEGGSESGPSPIEVVLQGLTRRR